MVLGLDLVGCFGHTEGVDTAIVVDGQVSSKVQSGDKVENLCVSVLRVDAEDTGDFALLTILTLEAVATELIREEVKLYSQHTLSVTVENGDSEVVCLLLEDFSKVNGRVALDAGAIAFDNAGFENCGEGGGGGQYGHCVFPFWVVSVLL